MSPDGWFHLVVIELSVVMNDVWDVGTQRCFFSQTVLALPSHVVSVLVRGGQGSVRPDGWFHFVPGELSVVMDDVWNVVLVLLCRLWLGV